jgi:hypothetical protein
MTEVATSGGDSGEAVRDVLWAAVEKHFGNVSAASKKQIADGQRFQLQG